MNRIILFCKNELYLFTWNCTHAIELMSCKMVLKNVVACWFNLSKLLLIQLLGHYSGNEATNMIGSLTARDWKDWRIPGLCSTLFRIKEDKQVAILLTVISRRTHALLSSLLAPTKPHEKLSKQLADTLCQHFHSKPLIIAEQFHFHKWQWNEWQTF